jgi:hypothetical protein
MADEAASIRTLSASNAVVSSSIHVAVIGRSAIGQGTGFFDQTSFAGLQFTELLAHLCSPEIKMPPSTYRDGGWMERKRMATVGSLQVWCSSTEAAPGCG